MYIDVDYKDKTFAVKFVAETVDGNIETHVSFGWREAEELRQQLDAHLRDWSYEMGGFDEPIDDNVVSIAQAKLARQYEDAF